MTSKASNELLVTSSVGMRSGTLQSLESELSQEVTIEQSSGDVTTMEAAEVVLSVKPVAEVVKGAVLLLLTSLKACSEM